MRKETGFTLVDLMIAVSIFALLGAVAMPMYTTYADRARIAEASSDILAIQLALDRFEARSFNYPDALNELQNVPTTDPWGGAYLYLRIDGNPNPGIRGQQRKDKNLNPLNSDFDLYSMGKDQVTRLPLTSRDARDDVIRAGNGGFVGVAEDH